MLRLWGQPRRFCDGINRRDFLGVGLGLGGLGLADVLRARANASSAVKQRPKSIIFIFLGGGPPHTDMYDLKPDAPAEYRGEFKPIRTNVPGFDICEHFPLQAKIADQLAVVRTVAFNPGLPDHSALELFTGHPSLTLDQKPQRPAFGSIVSRLCSARGDGMPRYVDCANGGKRWSLYAGAAHEPLTYDPLGADRQFWNLELRQGVGLERLQDRKRLLQSLDTLRRDVDRRVDEGRLDPFQARALEMIASGKVREAFDLRKEPDKVRQRYGKGVVALPNANYHYNHEPLLLARRLVEAGVSVVTVNAGAVWDLHGGIYQALRAQLPTLDQVVHGLVTELRERGLDKDVAIVMMGEMGRTPEVGGTPHVGRNHWTPNGFVLFAGGGLRMGQVIGATDAKGGYAKTRPLNYQNVLATCYHILGIDPAQTLTDMAGRPQTLLDDAKPIAELVS
jgi:hypothetical protein